MGIGYKNIFVNSKKLLALSNLTEILILKTYILEAQKYPYTFQNQGFKLTIGILDPSF